jgi:hypothetical protein
MGTKNGHDSLRWSSQSTPRALQTMPNLAFVFFQKGASLDSALALVGAVMPSSSASCASDFDAPAKLFRSCMTRENPRMT